MKKAILIIVLVALFVTLYSVSQAYANITTLTTAPNPSTPPAGTTTDYKTPMTSKPCPRTYGDPIQDPRPRSAIRAIMK